MNALREVIDRYSVEPFEYGISDCCTFAAECWCAVYGYSPLADLGWDNKADADAILAKHGNLYAAIVHALGAPLSTNAEARTGDVALVYYNGTRLAAVVAGSVLLVRTETGLMEWPLRWATAIWSANA